MTDLVEKSENGDSMVGEARDSISQVATDTRRAYEEDEGELSSATLEIIRKEAASLLPQGRVIRKRSLL